MKSKRCTIINSLYPYLRLLFVVYSVTYMDTPFLQKTREDLFVTTIYYVLLSSNGH